MPVTKHNYIVKNVSELADVIRSAFRIAREGRPGPVLVDICKDVTAATCEYTRKEPDDIKGIDDFPTEGDIEIAVKAIENSKMPLILAGGGVSIAGADEEVLAFAEKVKIPVTNTLMGLGSFPGTHKLFMGLVGMHGSKTSNMAVSKADLFIAIGARFSDR